MPLDPEDVDFLAEAPVEQAREAKVAISIRLDRSIVERFRATGPGWQTRINDVLREARP